MADLYKALFAPIASPPKEFEICPNCKTNRKPKNMILCGRCWRLLNDEQRRALLQERLDAVQHAQK